MGTGPPILAKIMSTGDNRAAMLQKSVEVKMAIKSASQNLEAEVAQKHSLKYTQ